MTPEQRRNLGLSIIALSQCVVGMGLHRAWEPLAWIFLGALGTVVGYAVGKERKI